MSTVPDNLYCDQCQARMAMKPPYIVARPVSDKKHHKVVEVGLQCKRCNHWHHAYYDSPVLVRPRRVMRGALARMIKTQQPKDAERYLNAKGRFENAYRALQEKMRATTGTEATPVLGKVN